MSLSVCILASTLDIGVSKDILSTHRYHVVDYPCDAGIIVVNKMKLSEGEIDARTIYALQHTAVVSEQWLEDLQFNEVSPYDYIICINDLSLNEGTRFSPFIPPENHSHFLQIKNVCQYGWIDPVFCLFSDELSGLSVHSDDTGAVYDAYFTKVSFENNINDFAHISLLYNDSDGYGYLFIRKGRIGKEGHVTKKKSLIFTEMKELFVRECKEFCSNYSLQNPITSYESSSYTYLPLGCSNENMSHSEGNKKYLFTLPMTPEVAYLTAVIHDKSVDQTILNSEPQHYEFYHGFSYDYEQQPLLPLSRETIELALAELNNMIEDMTSDSIVLISNKYYSLIPTVMTGYQSDYLLNRPGVLEREKNRLNNLLKEDHSINSFPILPKFDPDIIPTELKSLYADFHCQIREINKEDGMYRPIRGAMNALRFTAAQSQEFVVDRIFELIREEEKERPEVKSNKLWLWHGTGIKNVACILKQGLTDPQQSGRSGCGGIYFADNIAKSYQYVRGKPGQSLYPNIQPMFLCEVQCGNIKDAGSDFRNVGAAGGYDCVRGGGSLKPLKWKEIDGAKLALGMTSSSGVSDSNEYIIKNRMQVKLRYLVLYKV